MGLPVLLRAGIPGVLEPLHQTTGGGVAQAELTGQHQVHVAIAIDVMGRGGDIAAGRRADGVLLPAGIAVPDELRRGGGQRHDVPQTVAVDVCRRNAIAAGDGIVQQQAVEARRPGGLAGRHEAGEQHQHGGAQE
jgi:hypothetical protein